MMSFSPFSGSRFSFTLFIIYTRVVPFLDMFTLSRVDIKTSIVLLP